MQGCFQKSYLRICCSPDRMCSAARQCNPCTEKCEPHFSEYQVNIILLSFFENDEQVMSFSVAAEDVVC